MIHGSLFSGIGGFDLAADWMGWCNEFHCEWNEFGRKVLGHYWPQAKSYEDITKADFTIHEGQIDILTGGFPCQPYSVAGKRKGKEDERHLWPEMLRAIREIQPRWVVGENVRGLISWNGGLVFDEVQADLEAEGYQVQPFVLPACGINAPHRRDRVWFIAHSHHKRNSTGLRQVQKEDGEISERNNNAESGNASDRNATNSSKKRCGCRINHREERYIQDNINRNAEEDKPERNGRKCGACKIGENGNATNTKSKRHESSSNKRQSMDTQKEQRIYGRERNARTTSWENFPTVAPICDGNDGFPERLDGITFPKWRNESIKAGGNAIVPGVAFQIFKAIEAYEL